MAHAPAGREVESLDGWWHTWLDDAADWQREAPLPPGAPVDSLPVRAPSGGWQGMDWGMESTRVPGTLAQARPGFHGVAWQWRPIVIPEAWQGRRVILVFGGARQRAEVFLDDRPVGYDLDGLTPFAVDLTPHVRPGRQHELAVRLTNPGGWQSGEEAGPLRWASHALPGSCDVGGLWGGVALVSRPGLHLADLVAAAVEATGRVTACVVLRNAGAAAAAEVRVAAWDAEGRPAAEGMPERRVAMAEGEEAIVTLPLRIAAPYSWSPRRPYLYRLAAEVRSSGGRDHLEVPLGLRRVEEGDGLVSVNGEPLGSALGAAGGCARGAATLPTAAEAQRQVAHALAAGLDGLLATGWPATPELLDAADRAGLPVVQALVGIEDPAAVPTDARALYGALARDRLRRLIRRDRHHPSVVAWRLPVPRDVAAFDAYVRLALEEDPTRLVVPADALRPATGRT